MYKYPTVLALALSSLMLLDGYAYSGDAPDNRDVVTTREGVIVVNTFGNCVRTKWEAGSDACGPEPEVIKPHVRRPIAQEERTVYFGFNRSNLTPEAKAKLDTLANVLKSEDDVKEARIVGYADRIGSASYNEKLSGKRAEAVRKYIVSRGFINARVAETRWFGESHPATSCPDGLSRPELIDCLQKDRRVEVEIDYLPDGKAAERR